MAEAASSQELRCSKCRSGLGVQPDQLHDLEAKALDVTLWFLREDKLPEWIEQKVEECSWTKTKLHCPNCGVRVGGVDFVGGADHPVHLIKSKVDCALSAVAKEELRKLLNPSRPEQQQLHQPEQQQPSSSSTVDEQPSSSEQSSSVSPAPVLEMLLINNSSSSDEVSSDVSSATDESDESDISSQSSQLSSGSSSAELATSLSSSTSSSPSPTSDRNFLILDNEEEEEELSAEAATVILSKKQKNKLRLKRRRYEKLSLQRKLSKTLQEAKQIAEDRLIKKILEAEPELDELDHAVICPVCLDLLYEPFKVDPCKHIFCEPCLRRLGCKNPMNTSCPMCRQRIVYCEPQREFSKAIREAHHSMHIKRKKFERGTNVFTLPLPWRPGWRNLMSGRAMGGNRMANETNADAFRQFLQQLPYYIPPVVIANLINLLFFICLLGAFEIMPLLYSLIMGRGPMGMSALSRAAVSPVVEAPIGSSSNEPHDVETSAPLEDISVGSDIMRDVLRDVLNDIDDVDSSAMLGEIPLTPAGAASHPFEMPEAVGPAMDATFYYVLCTMSLIAAAFGNFLIVQQQPLFALIPQGTFFDRLYNHPAFGRHFQRFSDLFLIVGLSCVPILLLPLVLPSPSELPVPASSVDGSASTDSFLEPSETMLKYKQWMSSSFRSFIQVLILLIESVNSVMTFQNIVSLAVVYYVTCTFFNYRGIGAN